jgi:hypothetical protein
MNTVEAMQTSNLTTETEVAGNDWRRYPECAKGIGDVIRSADSAHKGIRYDWETQYK